MTQQTKTPKLTADDIANEILRELRCILRTPASLLAS